jgi:hypothetical protein
METGGISLQLLVYILLSVFMYLVHAIERYPGIIQILRITHLHVSIIVSYFSPSRPAWSPPNLLYNGYRVFPGGKERPGRAADHSPLSSAAVIDE